MTNCPDHKDTRDDPLEREHRWKDVEAVWVLVGSAGAGLAMQQFFNAFDVPPPVAFIYAQHYDPGKQDQLQQLTTENPLFQLCLAEGDHQLEPGKVLMIPPGGKVTIDTSGAVCSAGVPWEGEHTPDIDELLIIFSAANLPDSGVIFFSGMGCDGADVLNVLDAAGTRIWAQTPQSAICSGMPQAALNTGLVHRTGTPALLANELVKLYLSKS